MISTTVEPVATLRWLFQSRKLSRVLCGSALTAAALVTVSAQAKADTPSIPLVQASAPKLDGVITTNEWQNAFVLQAIGDTSQPKTTFYLQHDNEALWVAVNCIETNKNRPSAYKRGPQATLSIDDSVEVALGLEGGERNITMGGYAGAMSGKSASVRHLYGFAVNAAGSIARRYNENPLPTPHFEAKVGKISGGWQVEMRIPFASLGLKNPGGQEISANFIRYRTPAKVAWKGMRQWGNYTPFPTSRIRLAAKANEPRTPNETVTASGKSEESYQQSFSKVATPSLQYFPLSNSITGQIRLKAGETATLKAAGVSKQETSAKGGIVRVALNLPHRLKATESVEATLEKSSGTTTTISQQRKFHGETLPSWSGTDAGIKYLDGAVPKPWKKPVVQNKTVTLAHSTITFDDSALPSSIKIPAGELLSAPIAVQLVSGGKQVKVEWQKSTVTQSGVRPIINSRGRFGANVIEVRTEVDYDGFMIVQVRLSGKPQQLGKVQISCPMQPRHARYLSQGSAQTVWTVDNAGYKGTDLGIYGGNYWLGSEDGGLNFSTDLPFFKSAEHLGEVAVQVNSASRDLVLRSTDQTNQNSSGTTLQFYLQPTPVRAQSKVTMDDYSFWFEEWSDYQGYPDLAKMDQVKERVTKWHNEAPEGKKDAPYLLYFNQLLAENAPPFAQYRNELIAPPERMWYQRAYGVAKGVPCYVCCVRGPYGDLLLDGIRKLADEGGIGGVYMDGTTVNWICDNPAHVACNQNRPPMWGKSGDTRTLGTRNFLKRLRGIFDERGKPYYLVAHTGGGLDINTLSFVDQFWEGEQLARYLPGYRVPREQFAIGYSGSPWGYRTQFFDHTWLGERGENWSLVYTLLYNTENQKNGVRAFLRPFEGPGTAFHPYWNGGQKLLKQSKTGQTSVSYYTAPRGVMVIATNLGVLPDEVELKLDTIKTGQEADWVDLLGATPYKITNGVLRLTIPPYRGVVLRPLSQSKVLPVVEILSTPATVPDVKGMNLTSWQAGGTPEQRQDIAAGPDGSPWIIIKSPAGGTSVNAQLQETAIGRDAEVRLKVKSEVTPIMQLDVGPVDIIRDMGKWMIRGKSDDWNEKTPLQIPWEANQEIDLHVILRDNVLTVYVDGQVLIENMKLKPDGQGLRPLQIWTVAGSSLAFQLVSLSGKPGVPTVKFTQHPVLP